jgi:hypothetical protein
MKSLWIRNCFGFSRSLFDYGFLSILSDGVWLFLGSFMYRVHFMRQDKCHAVNMSFATS